MAFDKNSQRGLGSSFTPRSPIGLAAVTNAVDLQDPNLIGNFVNNAVVTNANSPIVLRSRQFAATGWARVLRKGRNGGDNSRSNVRSEPP